MLGSQPAMRPPQRLELSLERGVFGEQARPMREGPAFMPAVR